MRKYAVFSTLALLFAAWDAPRAQTAKYPHLKELAIVFVKGTDKRAAEKILQGYALPFREGSDSSRGKLYFYKTGPKYLLHVSEEQLADTKRRLESRREIYEVYYPDWSKQKD